MNNASIFVENALVIAHESLPAEQYLLRLEAPNCAQTVSPGNFVHLSCSRNPYNLKRPFSVMRASSNHGWIEVLYKVVGHGTRELSTTKPNDRLHCIGMIRIDSNFT